MFTTKNFFTLVGKHLLIGFVVVIFSSLLVFFLSGQISKVSKEATKNLELATELSERTSLLSTLKYDIGIIGTNDTIIKGSFIPSNNILEFVAILKSLALKNGVTHTFNFGIPSSAPTEGQFLITPIPYQNSINTNISTFIIYLKAFEKLPYFTKIDSLAITSGEGDWRKTSNVTFSATVAARLVQ